MRSREIFARLAAKLLAPSDAGTHSPAFLPSFKVRQLNNGNDDIIHLHWIAGETLSVRDIGQIRKPLVWTIHDMWPFCGAEHLASDRRWITGYTDNASARHFGFDLNAWTWRRKAMHWKKPIHIVAPSKWLADCARQSALMKHWPIHVIGNCIDPLSWRASDRASARKQLGLSSSAPIVVFGAAGGTRDPNKGFDLLTDALFPVRQQHPNLELLTFGGRPLENPAIDGVIQRSFGHVEDENMLRLIYCAADVVAVPSRVEAFCLVALEAQACGTPVTTFDASGTTDVIEHLNTGYVARAFDTQEFANGLNWCVSRRDDPSLRQACTRRALANFSSDAIGRQYTELYQSILAEER